MVSPLWTNFRTRSFFQNIGARDLCTLVLRLFLILSSACLITIRWSAVFVQANSSGLHGQTDDRQIGRWRTPWRMPDGASFTLNLNQICLGVASNLPQVCYRIASESPQICLRFSPGFLQTCFWFSSDLPPGLPNRFKFKVQDLEFRISSSAFKHLCQRTKLFSKLWKCLNKFGGALKKIS